MVEQQTWMTLLGVAGFALALFGYLAAMKRELRADIGGLRAELKGDNAELRTELKGDIAELRTELKSDISQLRTEIRGDLAKVDSRLTTLEQRTFDLSTRLPPAPARPGS